MYTVGFLLLHDFMRDYVFLEYPFAQISIFVVHVLIQQAYMLIAPFVSLTLFCTGRLLVVYLLASLTLKLN